MAGWIIRPLLRSFSDWEVAHQARRCFGMSRAGVAGDGWTLFQAAKDKRSRMNLVSLLNFLSRIE